MLLGNERALRLIGDSHTKMEHTVVVLGRENEVILAIFLDDIIVPHLFLGPLHLIHMKNHAVIGNLTIFNILHRNDMIVFHLEMTAIIVEGSTCLPVMRGIYIEFAIKYISRGVCIIIFRIKITWFHLLWIYNCLYLIFYFFFTIPTTCSQLCLHILVIFFGDGIQIKSGDTYTKQQGWYDARHQTDTFHGALILY